MDQTRENPWAKCALPPVEEREAKPRARGLTMVIDKGLGLYETRDLLGVCAPYIDFVKLAFGSSVLYGTHLLNAKLQEIRNHGVDVYPGGTLLELAGVQGRAEAFFERACELGFTGIEVSEGTVELSRFRRRRLIETARSIGLRVVSEVGKKDRNAQMDTTNVVRQVEEDLEWGAECVIIEGRDSGRGVGVYNDDGSPREALVDGILAGVSDPARLMWEAPITSQQQYWLRRVGINANLGNVQTNDVLTLESTRMGLRGDTLRDYVRRYVETM